MENKTDIYQGVSKLLNHLNEEMVKYYDDTLSNLDYPKVYTIDGNKYIRIMVDNRIWGFVKKDDGGIYKAATINQVAKHVRGSVFNDDPMKNCDIYGPKYLI